MMILPGLATVLVILSIQRYADASFFPPFSHHGHPMKPHFLGPPIHGPPMMLGPPPMYDHPIHDPFYMEEPYLMGPPGPMMPPTIIHKGFYPRKYLPPHKYDQPLSLRPFPRKYSAPLLPKMKPLSRKRPFKKPRRVLLIKRRINIPKIINPYGYERQLRRSRPLYRERGLADYENLPRNGYDNRYDSSYSGESYNFRNIRDQRRNTLGRPDRRRWDNIASGGDVYRNSNIRNGNNRRNNVRMPRLREVIDTGNRREMRRNSIRARTIGGSVKRQSTKRRRQRNNPKGLSGNTIDFSKSTVSSSTKSVGTDSLSSNLLDKSKAGIHSEQSSIRQERMRSRNNLARVSSVTTQIGKNPGNKQSNGVADVNSLPGKGLNHERGLSGSFIDLSHIGGDTGATHSRQNAEPGFSASSSVPARSGPLRSATASVAAAESAAAAVATAASVAASAVATNASGTAAAVTADLNGNALNPAANLGVIGAHDLFIIDSTRNGGNTPADVAAQAIPEASNGGVVDLTATSGALSGTNINNLGPNVDVLTLDNQAFAKLEKALQSGQTVDAQLLETILGGGGSARALSGGSASSALPSGKADVGITNVAAPEIYFLDSAQVQHLTESAGFSGNGGTSQLANSHTTSSSSTSSKSSSQKSSSTSSSSHAAIDIPHAGKVLPAGHGHAMPGRQGHGHTIPGGHGHSHDIVGVVGKPVGHITVGANTDIRGLFSLPTGNNLSNIPASVSSIPKSINQRMSGGHQHSGQGAHHQTSQTSMTSGPGHSTSAGHQHSGHSTH